MWYLPLIYFGIQPGFVDWPKNPVLCVKVLPLKQGFPPAATQSDKGVKTLSTLHALGLLRITTLYLAVSCDILWDMLPLRFISTPPCAEGEEGVGPTSVLRYVGGKIQENRERE